MTRVTAEFTTAMLPVFDIHFLGTSEQSLNDAFLQFYIYILKINTENHVVIFNTIYMNYII